MFKCHGDASRCPGGRASDVLEDLLDARLPKKAVRTHAVASLGPKPLAP